MMSGSGGDKDGEAEHLSSGLVISQFPANLNIWLEDLSDLTGAWTWIRWSRYGGPNPFKTVQTITKI